ncbi:secretion system protein [Pseudoalteromonas aurantia]|nr:type II secretion system F family protein [Pseudoalteromonas aurantia]TMO67099.1 secretion system protein [Pseudoalteromonas aurantia]
MPSFNYKAYDKSGAKVEGVIEAEDRNSVFDQLSALDLIPSNINVSSERSGLFFRTKKVSLGDLELFTSELSLLLTTGVRVDKGLEIIAKTKAKPILATMLRTISKDIQNGNTLSQALRKHETVFDNLYCNLVELGESTGDLSAVFKGLAKDLKFRRELRSKVISSLTYPLVILFVCMLSVLFIFNVIIPKMADMFAQVKELPWYTELMLSISEFMQNYQVLVLLCLCVLPFLVVVSLKASTLKPIKDKVTLKLPIISSAAITLERIRFNSGLALMLKAGLSLDRALELANSSVNNTHLKPELTIARKKVKEGEKLSATLSQTEIFPPFYISLLEVGEESGDLSRVFDEIAQRSRTEFESWTGRVTALLEPLMILFMGVFVGGVVVVMLMSMISVNDVSF